MKVQVSKVFAKFINDTAKEMGFQAEASVVYMSTMGYQMNVGDPYDGEDGGDWDWEKSKFKAIQIVYPYEYYACPLYLSTKRLCAEFRRRGIKTMQELKEMIRDLVEI